MNLNKESIFQFKGQVWKVHPDPYTDWLVVEVRSSETQEVSFAAFYRDELQWEGLQLEELWWLNSVGLFNGKLLVHQYDDSPFPSPAFLIGIDVTTQQIDFVLENKAFQAADDSVVQTVPSKSEFGNEIQYYQLVDGNESEERTLIPQQGKDIQLPTIYTEAESHFKTIQVFLEKKELPIPQIQIEYMELENCFVISTYHAQEKGHQQKLYLFNLEGELLKNWLLQNQIEGKSPQSFVVHYDRLWFFREKGELMVQNLD